MDEDIFDELIDSLLNLIEVKVDRDKARNDCDCSWGYYGAGREEELSQAKKRFSKAFRGAMEKSNTAQAEKEG